jgi:2-amino-4-hydroxy-6-hydroxymethyldihydropteridine diphosphokinase
VDGMTWTPALIGLGANLGDRLATLQSAARDVAAADGVRAVRASAVYESPPMGEAARFPFLNAALALETTRAPRSLLDLGLAIERAHGRVRDVRWGPRTLDIDLLWFMGITLNEAGLILPHPGFAQRAFVLRPAADLAPELVLPDGRTVAEAVEALSDDGCVRLPGAYL